MTIRNSQSIEEIIAQGEELVSLSNELLSLDMSAPDFLSRLDNINSRLKEMIKNRIESHAEFERKNMR